MSSFSWLTEFINWIVAWFPRLVVIHSNQSVVAFVRGKNVRVLPPGLSVYWPLVTNIWFVNRSMQIITTTNQILDTVDGNTVVCSAQVTFRIVDPIKYVVDVYEPEEAVIEAVLATIRDLLISWEYQALLVKKSEFNDQLTDAVAERLLNFGIRVERAAICDLARTRVICILNNQTSDKAFSIGNP